jgi:hypothetical protein
VVGTQVLGELERLVLDVDRDGGGPEDAGVLQRQVPETAVADLSCWWT